MPTSVEEVHPRVMYFRYEGGINVKGLTDAFDECVRLVNERGYASQEFVSIFDLRYSFIEKSDMRGLATATQFEPAPAMVYFVPNPKKIIITKFTQLTLHFAKRNFMMANNFDHALHLACERVSVFD